MGLDTPSPGRRRLLLIWAARAAFLAAIIITLWFAFSPPGAGPPLLPWDKAEHVLAFFTLTVLALAALPRLRVAWLALGLSLFGALIEIVQGLPLVHRDRDVWDWVADTVAVIAVLAVAAAVRLRAWLAGPGA